MTHVHEQGQMVEHYELLYTSIAADGFGHESALELLKSSIAKNTREGISGALIYMPHTNEFAQMLEGQRSTILRLYHKIQRDPRHHSLRLIFHRPSRNLTFAKSGMLMKTLDYSTTLYIQSMQKYLFSANTAKSRLIKLIDFQMLPQPPINHKSATLPK